MAINTIEIWTQASHLSAKQYVWDYCFSEILDISYTIHIHEAKEIFLKFEDKTMFMPDIFFERYPKTFHQILWDELQPQNPKSYTNPFTQEEIIGLYAMDRHFDVKEKEIHCPIDIFGSIFFFLTRIEEYFLSRDAYERVDEDQQFLIKHKLHEKPWVNIYMTLVENCFKHFGLPSKNLRSFSVIPTVDVDMRHKYLKSTSGLKEIGYLFKNARLSLVWDLIKDKIQYFKNKKDPYDCLEEMADMFKTNGLEGIFFFLPIHDAANATYELSHPEVQAQMEGIGRHHDIGLHLARNHSLELQLEKFQPKPKKMRAHFLKITFPNTYQDAISQDISEDYSLGYHHHIGFRSGICYDYPWFDIRANQKTMLRIFPLCLMEIAVDGYYPKINPNEFWKKSEQIILETKKYNGNFVFLWHNSNLKTAIWRPYRAIFERFIEQ